jgi:hypothetical protein
LVLSLASLTEDLMIWNMGVIPVPPAIMSKWGVRVGLIVSRAKVL